MKYGVLGIINLSFINFFWCKYVILGLQDLSEVLEFQVFQLVIVTCRIFIVLFYWIFCFISSVYSYLRSMENHRRNLEKLCRICGRKEMTGKGYWNAKDVGDYEDVMMLQYFFIKTKNESRKVFTMKIVFILLLIWLRDTLKKALLLVLTDSSEKLVQCCGQCWFRRHCTHVFQRLLRNMIIILK